MSDPTIRATAHGSRRAVIVSGGGRYADPWHPFAATSSRLAALLSGLGFDVETTDDVDAGLSGLDGGTDLLVANVGDPSRNGPEPAAGSAGRDGFLAHLARGRPVLAMHASSFPGIPEWSELTGGRWVDGISSHPPYGLVHVHVHAHLHPIVESLSEFDLHDEGYCDLRLAPDVVGLASHHHDGRDQPLLWAHERAGVRIVYDALGHDPRSYDSAEHRRILLRSVRWLTREQLSAA